MFFSHERPRHRSVTIPVCPQKPFQNFTSQICVHNPHPSPSSLSSPLYLARNTDYVKQCAVFSSLLLLLSLTSHILHSTPLCSSLATRHHVSHASSSSTSFSCNCAKCIWRGHYTHNLKYVCPTCSLHISSQVLLRLKNSIDVTNEINYGTSTHTTTAISLIGLFI